MPPTSPSPEIHALPDHYRVWQREDGSWWQLGRGAVYKATDQRTDETVALRFVDAGPRTRDNTGALAEYAALLARPGSPLVAPLRDFFLSGPFNVAATEFIDGESLAARVRRDGPLDAGAAWQIARLLLEALGSLHALGIAHGSLAPSNILFPTVATPETPLRLVEAGLHPSASVAVDPAAGSDATRGDLRCLGAALWFALTGDDLAPPPDAPLPWPRLDAAGITPDLGCLPVLLARTLGGETSSCPATAPALLGTLNVLATLTPAVPVWPDMPSRAPGPDPVAPTPPTTKPRLPDEEHGELWTRPTRQLAVPKSPNRRRQGPGRFWTSLCLLAVGGTAGFYAGVAHEMLRRGESPWPEWALRWLPSATPAVASAPPPAAIPAPLPTVAAPAPASTPAPAEPPLPASPPVSAAGIAARMGRIKTLQPDVSDILKYARELRRVATLPVPDEASFPTEALAARLRERFDWQDPASPNFHRTPLLLVLEYSTGVPGSPDQTETPQSADALAQALAADGLTSPIYTCGMSGIKDIPEIETRRAAGARFVEVWVAFTLF